MRKKRRRSRDAALNTLKLAAWGFFDWDEADGPTRDRVKKDVDRALRGSGLFIDGRGHQSYVTTGQRIFYLTQMSGRKRREPIAQGLFHVCCRRALQVIEPLPEQVTPCSFMS